VSLDTGALLDWYERVRRPLPWRATRDPYALLVS
jgi:A/G-specific adenine glycosylase